MSSQPFIQVVNDKDEPLYGMAIEKVYIEALTHRVVYVAMFNEYDQLLLQKRAAHIVTDPDKWDVSVGGHVDNEESYQETAIREMKEEIGLINIPIKKIAYFYQEAEMLGVIQKRFITIFEAHVKSDIAIKVDSNEVSKTKWFTISEIKEMISNNPSSAALGLKHYMEKCYDFKP